MNEKKIQEARRMLCLFLKTEAQKKGITNKMISDHTGFHQPNVNRVLNGNYAVSIDIFLKIADAIGVNIFLESKNSPSDINQTFEKAMHDLERRGNGSKPNEN